jgi:transcriptional regulator with XRE-family HTH domain
MNKPIQEIISKYRKQRNLSLRAFAKELSEGLKKEDKVTYQTIKNWEDGIHKPNFQFLMSLAMTVRDWRGDFAFDILAAMKPDIYEPMTSIGRDAISKDAISKDAISKAVK